MSDQNQPIPDRDLLLSIHKHQHTILYVLKFFILLFLRGSSAISEKEKEEIRKKVVDMGE